MRGRWIGTGERVPGRRLPASVRFVGPILILLTLVADPGGGWFHGPSLGAPRVPAPIAGEAGPAAVSYSLTGTVVLAHTGLAGVAADLPLAGVSVVAATMDAAYERCGGEFPTTAHCPIAAQTVTASGSSTGTFQLTLPAGTYWLYSKPSNASIPGGPAIPVGGDAAYVDLTADHVVSLVVYRLVGFGNLSFVLPAWNNLSAYTDNANGATQLPIVSYTQDGVFYVNATDRWVFYSFPNRTVDDLGAWTPLYGNVANYAGDLENTGFLTEDGTYLYAIGCSSSCTSSSSIEVAALNTTTHRAFRHTFTGVTDSGLSTNGGVDLIGEGGNTSIAVVIDASGLLHAWNFWNGTEWVLGQLPFFEANNNYWVPQLDSYVDVEAGGSTGDRVVQLRLEGPAPGTTIRTVATATTGVGIVSNYVDGIALNLSANEIAFGYGFLRGSQGVTAVYGLTNGVLGSELRTYDGIPTGAWPNNSALPDPLADEHRPSVTTGAPVVQSFVNVLFYNNSVLVDPFTGAYYDTNVSEPNLFGFDKFNESIPAGNGPAPSNLFYNGSYFLTGYSVNCALQTSNDLCPLRGTTPGTVAGTVYWSWQLGLPTFPFPRGDSIAETVGPSAPNVTASLLAPGTVAANWSVADAARVTNWTVWVGVSGHGSPAVYNEPANTRSLSWSGLPTGGVDTVTVLPWNLHGAGRATSVTVRVPSVSWWPVKFFGLGLPLSSPAWSVVVNGTVFVEQNATVALSLTNGTYPFVVRPPLGFTATPVSGSFTVAGNGTTIYLRFEPLTYPVIFQILCGITSVTLENWSVEVNGVNFSGTSERIQFEEPNGSYTFVVAPPPGVPLSPSDGAFNVSGAPVTVCFSIATTALPTYTVLVVESGLTAGTRWSVVWGGAPINATTPWIVWNFTNGTYSLSVPGVPGYTVGSVPPQVVVAGRPLVIGVAFTPIPTTPTPVNSSAGPAFPWVTFGAAVAAAAAGGLGLGYALTRRRRTEAEAPAATDDAGDEGPAAE